MSRPHSECANAERFGTFSEFCKFCFNVRKRDHVGGGGGVYCILGITAYSESELSSLFSWSAQAGTPLGHTSPCLWMGTKSNHLIVSSWIKAGFCSWSRWLAEDL